MADLNQIDQFINDVSDQAAAWYSIATQQPVVVPSAQIAGQNIAVGAIPAAPQPILDTSGGSWLIIGLIGVVLAIVILK